jgi:hypothetical protein
VGLLQCLCQTIDFVRNRDQVDMVRHEAISNEGDAVEDDVLAQQLEVDCSIGAAVQDEAPPVPTLCHMVWHVNGNHTSESSHARKRYQESFRRTGGSAKIKMRSCCAAMRSAKTSEKWRPVQHFEQSSSPGTDHKSFKSLTRALMKLV